MTYEPVTDWRKRAQELEAALAETEAERLAVSEKYQDALHQLSELLPAGLALNTVKARAQKLERENAELRARLVAVPAYVRYLGNWRAGDGVVLDFGEWYDATHTPAVDDDIDAPLKLATVEGGDE